MRQVIERWDPAHKPTESPPESTLLQILRDAGLGRVIPQYEICDQEGRFVARTDVGIPDDRIAVEYDSDQEHTDEMSLARDNSRRNRIMAVGWIVVSARKADLERGGRELLAAIRAHRRSQLA
jgi:very-short-patch-repair endonuclease